MIFPGILASAEPEIQLQATLQKNTNTETFPVSDTSGNVTPVKVNGAGGTVTYAWTKVSGAAGVSLGNAANVATQNFDLTNAGAAGDYVATFRCTITDSAGNTASADIVVTFTVVDISSGLTEHITFTSETAAPSNTFDDPESANIGVKFYMTSAGNITGMRWYCTPWLASQGVTLQLFEYGDISNNYRGTPLASKTISAASLTSGWRNDYFDTPYTSATANTDYVVCFYGSPVGYGYRHFDFSSNVTDGPVVFPGNTYGDGVNGPFAYDNDYSFDGDGPFVPFREFNDAWYYLGPIVET